MLKIAQKQRISRGDASKRRTKQNHAYVLAIQSKLLSENLDHPTFKIPPSRVQLQAYPAFMTR